MDLKAASLSIIVAFASVHAGALTQSELADRAEVVPLGKPQAPPGLLPDSAVGEYKETNLGLRSFWSDDTINGFFENVAEGTLDQVQPLVAELCDKWQHRDVRLPATGIISVPPDIKLDLPGCAGEINGLDCFGLPTTLFELCSAFGRGHLSGRPLD